MSTDIGDEEVELTLYDGAGLKAIDDALIAAFEEEYPNVTVRPGSIPTTCRHRTPRACWRRTTRPDIARVNALADIVGNGQLTNLDTYAEAYGWDRPPRGSAGDVPRE